MSYPCSGVIQTGSVRIIMIMINLKVFCQVKNGWFLPAIPVFWAICNTIKIKAAPTLVG